MATAIFGGGCFWCTEAVFDALKGVSLVEPGYTGGHVEQPTYEQICRADTGHIEVIRIEFDPEIVSFDTLLEVFFATHDPTTPERQGNDVGPQYQSAVFYQDEEQHRVAQVAVEALNASGAWSQPVCTKLLPAEKFWVAESYHHNYFAENSRQGYCQFIIVPKMAKLTKQFSHQLKKHGGLA